MDFKYCRKCLQPNTRPNIRFSEDGICPACIYFDSLAEVDWDEREAELKEIVSFGKANNHSGYDCIIGVSGGKDSTRQAVFVREKLGMKPLLVSLLPPPQQLTQRGADNISNLIALGFDCISINPAPGIWPKLMSKGFFEFVNGFKSTELTLFSSVPRLAIAYQIPLIWWGENAAHQLGDLGVLGKTGSDGNKLKHMNTLKGGDISWLLSDEIKKNQILQYCYPSDEEMVRANLRIVFLGYFWKDWSLLDNGNFSALRGLDIRGEHPSQIGDYLGITALDDDWTAMNQMIKYLKFGFGRVTDCANEDIRCGRITREEAISIVERYDGASMPEFVDSYCSFTDITVAQFWEVVDKCVDRRLFRRIREGKYERLFKVGYGL